MIVEGVEMDDVEVLVTNNVADDMTRSSSISMVFGKYMAG